ncbi:hypothetical protein [Enterobacter hormaechei]|uniref:hypothetical protein n=1 Tax=Enterobacter hormaechei TaxID=158836 RepID=UPI001BD67647|nr:hypothetical protein [Enterobacter hormaechei]
MSNIDKHAVQAVADLKAGYTLGHADVAILNELARIALASLEAEPVGYMNRFTGRVFTLEEQPGADTDAQVYVPLYTAPPAPVSVPDAATAIRECMEEFPESVHDIVEECAAIAENACRAAMLQGAAGNSPVIPDGWVLVPEEPTHEMLEAGDEQFGTYDVYRRMIAASPQQEVK